MVCSECGGEELSELGGEESSEQSERFLRRAEFKRRIGVKSDATLFTWERTLKGFPQRRRIGPNAVGWLLSEVLEYLRSRPVGPGRRPFKAIEVRHRGS